MALFESFFLIKIEMDVRSSTSKFSSAMGQDVIKFLSRRETVKDDGMSCGFKGPLLAAFFDMSTRVFAKCFVNG